MTTHKYNQEDIDRMFNYMLNGEELGCRDDCERIQKVIKTKRGINISFSEAASFWKKRSFWWDASWLVLPKKDDELIEYWDRFVNWWHKDDIDE